MSRVELRVEGLAELRQALKKAEQVDDLGQLRDGLKNAADVVARDAAGRVRSRTGRARASLRAVSGGNKAFVVGGKASVPYYGWWDFGSRNARSGRPRSVGPWAGTGAGPEKGRAIYVALDARERQVVDLVSDAVMHALKRLGM